MSLPPIGAADDAVVPVFFLSDSTGISAETMGNALLIQFPDLVFERTTIPFIKSVEEAREVVAILDEAMDGPVTPLAFTTAAEDHIRHELAKTRAPIIDFFEMHMGKVEGVLGQRGVREVGPAARRRRHQALQHPDGRGRVHHRARRRAEPARARPRRRRPARAVALRQDPDEHVPRAAARAVRRQLPAGRGGPRVARPAAPGARPRRPLLRHHHHRRAAQPGAQRAPPGLEVRRRSTSAAGSCARPASSTPRHQIPVIDSSAKSVEEMATLVLQTLKRSGGVPSRRAQQGPRRPGRHHAT